VSRAKHRARLAPRLPPLNAVASGALMTEAIDGDDERARLDKELQKPIRVQVIRPHGFAVPDDPEAIKRENAQMEELHEKAVAAARREKLKLLCRRYSLSEDDFEGLALTLAIKHEPGFKEVNRQLAVLKVRVRKAKIPKAAETPSTPGESPEAYQPVLIKVKEGELVDKPSGRPIDWSPERLLQLLEAVKTEKQKAEKEKSGLSTDLEALRCLARKKEWSQPPNHRGGYNAWVSTLQKRLPDAKQLKRRVDALNAIIEEAKQEVTIAGGIRTA
jgi:hypothetical protein